MPLPRRTCASLWLLLVLVAGLVAAGSAAAASAQEMECCPAGMEAPCTWLGAGDCCPERPTAPAPTPPTCAAPPPATPVIAALGAAPPLPLALPFSAPHTGARNLVLRL